MKNKYDDVLFKPIRRATSGSDTNFDTGYDNIRETPISTSSYGASPYAQVVPTQSEAVEARGFRYTPPPTSGMKLEDIPARPKYVRPPSPYSNLAKQQIIQPRVPQIIQPVIPKTAQPIIPQTVQPIIPHGNGVIESVQRPATPPPFRKPISSSSSTGKDKIFLNALKSKESSNDYGVVNQLGYLGAYQMGAMALADIGYVKRGTKNRDLSNPKVWLKGNKTSFLSSKASQDRAAVALLKKNRGYLRKELKGKSLNEQYGMLGAAHLLGAKGSKNLTSVDANNVSGSSYYDFFNGLQY